MSMIEIIKKTLEEIKRTSKVYEWDNINDVIRVVNQMDVECVIVYINSNGYTCSTSIDHFLNTYTEASNDNRRLLLIPHHLFQYIQRLVSPLDDKVDREIIDYIVKYLNESYPDFNFYNAFGYIFEY
jgi:uncharacterized membrane-anchored protein YjiN (DUF445 family)